MAGKAMSRTVPLLLARSTQPWSVSPPHAHWHDALKYIAIHKDISTFPQGLLVDSDEYTYTICDGYPKAQYHFLILPRIPFYVDHGQERTQVPESDMESISTLLKSRYASDVLLRLNDARDRLVARIHESMKQSRIRPDGAYAYYPDTEAEWGHTVWGVQCGFHNVPSMRHLHLHVRDSLLTAGNFDRHGLCATQAEKGTCIACLHDSTTCPSIPTWSIGFLWSRLNSGLSKVGHSSHILQSTTKVCWKDRL